MNGYYSTEEASKFLGISRRGAAKRLRMLKNIPEAFIGGPYKTSKCFYKYAITPLKTLLLVASSPYWFKKFTQLTVAFWFIIIIFIIGVGCYG